LNFDSMIILSFSHITYTQYEFLQIYLFLRGKRKRKTLKS